MKITASVVAARRGTGLVARLLARVATQAPSSGGRADATVDPARPEKSSRE